MGFGHQEDVYFLGIKEHFYFFYGLGQYFGMSPNWNIFGMTVTNSDLIHDEMKSVLKADNACYY
jgi:hypothetical protein